MNSEVTDQYQCIVPGKYVPHFVWFSLNFPRGIFPTKIISYVYLSEAYITPFLGNLTFLLSESDGKILKVAT